MSIYFARHGQTEWNSLRRVQGTTDIPLNDKGIEQAKQLCREIADGNIRLSKIYSSYQKRASETARIIGDELGVECEILDGIQEMDLGDFEGHTWEEITGMYPGELEEWRSNRRYNRAPNGESYQMVLNRVIAALESVIDFDGDERDVLIITHGAVIMPLIALKNDIPFNDPQLIKVENAKTVEFSLEDLREIRKKL